jgi:hypothetical protein
LVINIKPNSIFRRYIMWINEDFTARRWLAIVLFAIIPVFVGTSVAHATCTLDTEELKEQFEQIGVGWEDVKAALDPDAAEPPPIEEAGRLITEWDANHRNVLTCFAERIAADAFLDAPAIMAEALRGVTASAYRCNPIPDDLSLCRNLQDLSIHTCSEEPGFCPTGGNPLYKSFLMPIEDVFTVGGPTNTPASGRTVLWFNETKGFGF